MPYPQAHRVPVRLVDQVQAALAYMRERYGASLIMSDHGGIVSGVEGDNTRVSVDEMAADWSDRAVLLELVRRQEAQMAAIDDLRAAVQSMQDAANAEHAELGAVVDQLSTVEGQLTQLQATASQGGTVSEADIAAVTETVTGIAQTAQTAVDNAKVDAAAAAGGGGPAPAAPAAPTAAPAPAPTTDPTTGAPVVTDPTATPTAGSPVDPTATDPTGGVQVNERTVYVTSADPATIDPTTWPAAPVETDEDPPRQLYYFAGDTEAGQENGAGVAGFEVYTGATQGTVAATATNPDAGGGAAPGEA